MSKGAGLFLLGVIVGSVATTMLQQIRIETFDEEMDDLVDRLGREVDELDRRSIRASNKRARK